MTNQDLRIQRAKQDAAGRSNSFRPTVARTTRFVVLLAPSAYYPDSNPALGFARWVGESLPAFKFDAGHGYWFAPLTGENVHLAIEAMNRRDNSANFSQGITAWLDSGGEA